MNLIARDLKYWPTKQAAENDPVVADAMNAQPKVVFSRTMDRPSWRNTRVVHDDLPGSVRQMKQEEGEPMVILGSGSIVQQLAQEGLIDELQLVVNPVALGEGKTLLSGIKDPLSFKLTKTKKFKNGNVLNCYENGG